MYTYSSSLLFVQGDIPPEAEGEEPSSKKIRTDYILYGSWCYGNTIDLQRGEGASCSYTIYQEFNGTERTITNAGNPTSYTPYYDTDYNKQYPRFRVKAWLSSNNDFSPEDLDVKQMTAIMASLWDVREGRLTHDELADRIDDPYMQPPYPPNFWFIDEDKITHSQIPETIYQGSFCNCKNLRRAIIPPSVEYIGDHAFADTDLTQVRIASDCVYSPTSFPPNCSITFYEQE